MLKQRLRSKVVLKEIRRLKLVSWPRGLRIRRRLVVRPWQPPVEIRWGNRTMLVTTRLPERRLLHQWMAGRFGVILTNPGGESMVMIRLRDLLRSRRRGESNER